MRKWFRLPEYSVKLVRRRIESRARRATAQAKTLRYELLSCCSTSLLRCRQIQPSRHGSERLRGDGQWKNWPQRAKAVKPERQSSHLSAKTRSRRACCQRTCESCPCYLRRKQWVSLGRRACQLSSGPREENRGVNDSTRTTSSSKRSSGWLRL